VKDSISINRDEIAHLAYLNWQKDGCPQGRDQAYWLEAEHQLKATKHLLAVAHAAPAQVQKPLPAIAREAQTNGPKPVTKSKPKAARKTSVRSEAARSI
jgi:hypothetical protein